MVDDGWNGGGFERPYDGVVRRYDGRTRVRPPGARSGRGARAAGASRAWAGRDSCVLLIWIAVRSAVASIAVMLFALTTLGYQPGDQGLPSPAGDTYAAILTPGVHAPYVASGSSR